LILSLMLGQAFAARRALVIGNAAYGDRPLRNPVNDANLMHQTMEEVGFISTLKTNVSVVEFERAIIDFAQKINSNDEISFTTAAMACRSKGKTTFCPWARISPISPPPNAAAR